MRVENWKQNLRIINLEHGNRIPGSESGGGNLLGVIYCTIQPYL